MNADAATSTAVWDTIQSMADAYGRRDLEGFMSHFVDADDVFIFGTGADERRLGGGAIREQVLRDWGQTDTIAMSFESPIVSRHGPVAWLAVEGHFDLSAGGEEMSVPARLTAVLQEMDGGWKVAQAHFSAPMAGQEEGQSF
jgi:ketosteroid isomerase-like protein